MNPSQPKRATPPHGLAGRKFYAPLEPERFVTSSLACVRCGYNLKTLNTRRLCPECGEPVERSVRRHTAERFRRLWDMSHHVGGAGAGWHVNRCLPAVGMILLGVVLLVADLEPAGGRSPAYGVSTIAALALLGGGAYTLFCKLFRPSR